MKRRDPKQAIIDRQAAEIARLRAELSAYVDVANEQAARIVELER